MLYDFKLSFNYFTIEYEVMTNMRVYKSLLYYLVNEYFFLMNNNSKKIMTFNTSFK